MSLYDECMAIIEGSQYNGESEINPIMEAFFKKKKRQELSKEFLQEIGPALKKAMNDFKSDPKSKDSIKRGLKRYDREFSNDSGYKPVKFETLKLVVDGPHDCSLAGKPNTRVYYALCNDRQIVRICISDIISKDIAKRVKYITDKYPEVKVGTGDGDEGCIYFSVDRKV